MPFTFGTSKPVNRSQNSPLMKNSNLAIVPVAFQLLSHPTGDACSVQLPKTPFQSGISKPVNVLLISQNIHFPLTALFRSPCGKFLASVDGDGNLRKWEFDKLTTNTSIPVVTSLPKAINWVQYTYSSDGVLLAAMVSGTTITILDVERNRKIATLVHKEVVQKVRFSQEGITIGYNR